MSKTYLTADAICAAAREMVGKYTYDKVDCIRVVQIPLEKAGAKFPYTGSNYFVRFEVSNLQRLKSADQLKPGRAVFRSKDTYESGYLLPERYKKGGKLDTGDDRDFHHIGLVLENREIVDSNLTRNGRGEIIQDGPAIGANWKSWEWVADIDKVDYGEDGAGKEVKNVDAVIIGKVKVATPNGGYLNIRDVNGNDIGDIQNGTVLPLLEKTDDKRWKVDHNGIIGYCAREFLQEITETAADLVAVLLPRETWQVIKDAMAMAGL